MDKKISVKILLVNPPVKNIKEPIHDTPDFLHLGLCHLYSTLKYNKKNVLFFDCKFQRKNNMWLLNQIERLKPDIVGFTAKSVDINNVLNLSKDIKKINNKIKVLIGGPHATACYKEILKEKSIDMCGIGEFETGIIKLVNCLENKRSFIEVPSLVWKKDKEIIENKRYSNTADIVPVIWKDLPRTSKYFIMASRGCPQRCIFCMRVLGEKVRFRDVNHIMEEIDNIVKINPEAEIEFADETFTLNKIFIKKLCKKIFGKYKNKLKLIASTRIDRIDDDVLRDLKKAGFIKIIAGFESGSYKVLNNSKKDIDLKKALYTSKIIKKFKIKLEANFMVGLPGENIISIIQTAMFAGRLKPDNISVSIACPYPGTELNNMCKEKKYGLKIISHDYSDFNNELGNAMELDNMSRRIMELSQLFIYIMSFLLKLRIKEFLVFSGKYSKEAFSFLKHFIRV